MIHTITAKYPRIQATFACHDILSGAATPVTPDHFANDHDCHDEDIEQSISTTEQARLSASTHWSAGCARVGLGFLPVGQKIMGGGTLVEIGEASDLTPDLVESLCQTGIFEIPHGVKILVGFGNGGLFGNHPGVERTTDITE